MTESFEAKKHAYRQTQDGIVVSFTIHPNDMPEHLALAPLGTRFGVAVAEIGDDEQPKLSHTVRAEAEREPRGASVSANDPVPPVVLPKDRRPFASLPLSQQCGIRCADKTFQDYICNVFWNTNAEPTEDYTTTLVKNYLQVDSRAELNDANNRIAIKEWHRLEGLYQAHLTDRKYAGAVR